MAFGAGGSSAYAWRSREYPLVVTEAAPVPVIIVNYNSSDWTIKCLRSLALIEQPPVAPIVVDDASSDGSVEEIRACCPGVRVLIAPANRGFGAANNTGIQAALRENPAYVWLLNNDTEVDADCLKLLLTKADRDPSLGVVGAMVYDLMDKERVQVAGGGYVSKRLALTGHHRSANKPLGFITGVSMLIRREVLRATGGFDERFFLYLEDVDLSVRVAAEGWRLALEPSARVWHQGGATTSVRGSRRSPAMDRIIAASTTLFICKHAGRSWPFWLAVRVMLMLIRRLTPRRALSIGWMLRGVLDGLKASR